MSAPIKYMTIKQRVFLAALSSVICEQIRDLNYREKRAIGLGSKQAADLLAGLTPNLTVITLMRVADAAGVTLGEMLAKAERLAK